MSYTPMIQQYLDIKNKYRDAVLFFRLGDFYEMFFDDALLASRLLEITLTGRDAGMPERVPMCGVPYHAAEQYIARLIQKGYKVAICDQVEDPSEARGIVRREVVRVITPGTVLEQSTLEENSYNFLAAVSVGEGGYGIVSADVSTGLFQATQVDGPEKDALLIEELHQIRPAELVIPPSLDGGTLISEATSSLRLTVTVYDQAKYTRETGSKKLNTILGKSWREKLALFPHAVDAAGALLSYIEETQKKEAFQIKSIQVYSRGQYLIMDQTTRRNLELTTSLRDGGRWGTLIWVLDRTRTAMGGRLIKSWMEKPLLDIREVNARLDAVEEVRNNVIMRHHFKSALTHFYDLERLASRVVYGTANARDLLALRDSLAALPGFKQSLGLTGSELLRRCYKDIDPFTDLHLLLSRSVAENPPATVRDGGIIKDGFNPEIDRLRRVRSEGRSWMARLEAAERDKTGIRSLKIGYNKVFGYYIEITRPNLDQAPEYYIRKQTLANAERFITSELKEMEETILSAGDRLVQLEYEVFTGIREQSAASVARIQQTSRAVATVDVIISLAEAAVEENYVRPALSADNILFVRDSRHPVVEKVLGTDRFVPNNVDMRSDENVILLTGPNMAGKSTYIRQVALLVVMAQMGSFIPAEEARIGVADKIFTRIGAADDLAGGQSTFMVEMVECRNIINGASGSSLILMDEVGRGTSTYDGISIARALIEYIAENIRARTLFSTHYHELTDLDRIPGVVNHTMAVMDRDQSIVFLKKVIPGRADRSYGIHVASLAGLPDKIIDRAEKIMSQLAGCSPAEAQAAAGFASGRDLRDTDSSAGSIIANELTGIDLHGTTPLKALGILARWQAMIAGENGKG